MENFIKETLFKAGEEILKFYGKSSVLYSKGSVVDVVTEADLASNKIITEAIKDKYPDHGIVSEEFEGYKINSDYLWYIDPLDGTKNFSTGTPLFGINIALAFKNKIIHAAIYLPLLKDFCYAEEGKGAFLNNEKIECSQKEDWKGSYGLGSVRFPLEYENFQLSIKGISDNTGWIGAIASSAVSGLWVSSGKRDWYIGPSKNSWDYAATSLIAKEAGAMVSNFEGEGYKPGDRGLVVANKFIFPKLIEFVKKSYGNK